MRIYDLIYDVTSLSLETSAGNAFKMAAPSTIIIDNFVVLPTIQACKSKTKPFVKSIKL